MSDAATSEVDGREEGLEELNRRVEADEYCHIGMERHAAGDLEDAAAYYQLSLDIFPTAEAHTSLGVTLAARGEWEAAIRQCEEAIRLDPELGNAYNDMAVYLAELGKRHEALTLLDQALTAERYDCRHYAHFHRGRILEQMARFTEARDAFRAALDIEPDWEPAQRGYSRLLGWLN
ncbi:MAG: hypothetical protein OHK0029_17400 [Armatimonadaceae bacterium]